MKEAVIVGMLVGLCSCGSVPDLNVQAFEIKYESPGGVFSYRTYYDGSLNMYESQYRSDSIESHFKFDSIHHKMVSEEKIISSRWLSHYFVFHRDSIYGYNYDANTAIENAARLRADSVVRMIRGTNTFDSVILRKPDSVFWNEGRTQLKEVYRWNAQDNIPGGRQNFYYSAKMRLLKESLNEAVDKAKGLKFYKVETITDPFYDSISKRQFPSMTTMEEIKVLHLDNAEEILSMFKRYRKNCGWMK